MTTERTPTRSDLQHRVSLFGVIRSEVLKLMSVRTSLVTLLMIIPVTAGFVLLDAPGKAEFLTMDTEANAQILAATLTSAASIGWLLAIIVSVLSVSGEYSTGQIGSTLTVVPRRGLVLLAKTVAVAGMVWAVVFVAVLVPAVFVVPMLAAAGPLPPLGTLLATVALAAAGAATATALLALIALCIGGVLRSIAFSVAAAFGLILVVPGLVALAPIPWLRDLSPYTPTSTAQSLYAADPVIAPPIALLVLGGMIVVGLAAWMLTLTRRDA